MVKKIAGEDTTEISPTLGFNIHSLQFKGCASEAYLLQWFFRAGTAAQAKHVLLCRVRLNIWDVGGQATLRPYWQNYYERTDALLWVWLHRTNPHFQHACLLACFQPATYPHALMARL